MNSILKQYETDDRVSVLYAERWTDGRVAQGGVTYPLVEVTGVHRPRGVPQPTILVRQACNIRRR